MAHYRIVLDFEGPAVPFPPPATPPPRYYAQLVLQLLALDPNLMDSSLTRDIIEATFPGTSLVTAQLAESAAA